METNTELSIDQQIQYARGGLVFNGKDWNGYYYYKGDRSDLSECAYSSFGGKAAGDYGVLQADEFTNEFAEVLRREGIVKDEAISKITNEIRWMSRENRWVDDEIVNRFRAGPLNAEQEDENIKTGLNFLGRDYNGYQYSYGRRDSRKPGSTQWGSGKEGEKGIQNIEEFAPEFESAVKRDCVVSEQAIQRALNKIRQLVGTDGLVNGEVIQNFKN
jgi:hypothetical protein